LLSLVARRLPSYDGLQRVVSIASLDVAEEPAAPQPKLLGPLTDD
jgi:hypothetical protein